MSATFPRGFRLPTERPPRFEEPEPKLATGERAEYLAANAVAEILIRDRTIWNQRRRIHLLEQTVDTLRAEIRAVKRGRIPAR